MTDHYDEEAQVEQLRQWLRDNWFPLASGLALGLAAIFGWQAWGQLQDNHAGAASHVFEDLGKAAAQDKYDDAKAMADRLVKDFSDTPYAAAGALKLAEVAVQDNKLDDAILFCSGSGFASGALTMARWQPPQAYFLRRVSRIWIEAGT